MQIKQKEMLNFLSHKNMSAKSKNAISARMTQNVTKNSSETF